ncbi:MAG: TonB-dependent receptor [Betaproteobacteria bacterium]|jgi:outer membrane cobalamin receptor|nr:TonB-dependent receptor [Pseudomonadota bacterium]NBO04644.1 TonB-dependent receptor [Betaproteobacteria bacterium]NBP33811.1 TonB-dependent receptor [Betaproteobacteria bacterium]NBQ77779.1 TonB-dependent receptor [Betaproteobacteria bacterium]NBQ94198.1 TonB-dependent receptor [Betaproteobacteria bacterium]
MKLSKAPYRVLAAGICLLSVHLTMQAQPLAAKDASASGEELVISAKRIEQDRLKASVVVEVIDRQQIEASGAGNLAEFLEAVPGLSLTRLYGRMGVDANIDVGYLGEAGSQNVLFLIDGQRQNALDSSNLRLSRLPISSIERIEIRKANAGALYGDRAQGGVIHVITRTDQSKQLSVGAGSYGSKHVDTYLGFGGEQLKASLSYRAAESDGYRASSRANQDSAQFRVVGQGDWGRINVFARGFKERAQLPSYLTLEEFTLTPRKAGAYPVASERQGEAFGLRYDGSLAPGLSWSVDVNEQSTRDKTYESIHNRRTLINPEFLAQIGAWQWLAGGELSQAQARTEAGKIVEQRNRAIYIQSSRPLLADLDLELGARSQRAINQFQAEPGALATASTYQQSALSAAFNTRVAKNLSLRAGALTGFRLANADEVYFFDRETYALLRINEAVKPMTTRELFAQLEAVHFEQRYAIHYRHIKANQEIGYQYDCGVIDGLKASCNQNLYDTERHMLSAQLRWPLSKALLLRASVDLVDAQIASEANAGRRVPLTPKQAARLGLAWRFQSFVLHANAHYRGAMVQAADQSNSNPLIPGRQTIDLGLSTSLNQRLQLAAWIRNLTDKSYYDYATYNGIYPADRRSFDVSLKLSI